MRILLLIITLFLSNQILGQEKFEISGRLTGFGEQALVKVTHDNITLDSCYLKNNRFMLKGSLEEQPAGIYLIVTEGKTYKSCDSMTSD